MPSYGSCTASTISPKSFAVAQALLLRLESDASGCVEKEFDRVRGEFSELCGIASSPETAVVFAASGTDIHLIAAQMTASAGMGSTQNTRPLLIVTTEATETGAGVPSALAARHYSENAAMAGPVCLDEFLQETRAVEIAVVPSRDAGGIPVPAQDLDAKVEALVDRTAARGQSVMLVALDLSKTGLLAPSPACALRLKRRHPDLVNVLVDACQFRLTPSSIRSYVDQDFLVALTGSKFVTGPAFSGALLAPPNLARRWRERPLPKSMSAYCARADWPQGWAARKAMKHAANIGLLLRWEAALSELKSFFALDQSAVANFLGEFASAVQKKLTDDSSFEPLDVFKPVRGSAALKNAWDSIPTIFPFLLRRRRYLDIEETKGVYKNLLARHGQIGQPAICGQRKGNPVGALRLCSSMRLAVDALSPSGRGSSFVIAEALGLLDKVSTLF